ncbi:MAG: hypothetical protein KF809_17525 [Chloroflexi bacterium]|nr:hypothetical protein [Chloroflexota bacterium]
MDHAEVRAFLIETMERPGGLMTLQDDPDPTAVAVRAHIAGCIECAAEWQAWSLTTLGLASAAPDVEGPGPEVRASIMAAVAARPRLAPRDAGATVAPGTPVGGPRPGAGTPVPASQVAPDALAVPPTADPASGTRSGGRREGWVRGNQLRASAPRPPTATTTSTRDRTRLVLVGIAAALALLLTGVVVGGQLGSEPQVARPDPGPVLRMTAAILQREGGIMARLTTPTGDPGGVVLVSPGTGELAVVSGALEPPPTPDRYWCFLERDGTEYRVGPMHMDGALAFWAGTPQGDVPADLGRQGDRFIVRLEAPGASPALTGTF